MPTEDLGGIVATDVMKRGYYRAKGLHLAPGSGLGIRVMSFWFLVGYLEVAQLDQDFLGT